MITDTDTGRIDRVKGVLLGQAVGDSLGSGYEFRTPPAYGRAVFRRGTFGHSVAQWTDDSEQAVCVARARSESLEVAANLLAWFRANPIDCGAQTAAVMSRARTPRGLAMAARAYAARQAVAPRPRGWDPGSGNGSLMRTGPVCLPMLGDRERIAETARKISALTHADDWACDACVIWSLAVEAAIRTGGDWTTDEVRGALAFIPPDRRGFWRTVIGKALDGPQPSSRNGSAVGAFTCALWAVAHSGSLEEGIYRVVSLGGDSDTTAAIAGSLLGARFGASAVPAKWRSRVWGWPGYRAADLEALALRAAGVAESAQVTA